MIGGDRARAIPARAPLSGAARAWLVGLALLLILPAAAVRLQDEDALRAFHNRVLAPWPSGRALRRDPAAYFAQANRWLADRVYPIASAVALKNDLAWFVLGDPPSANITVGPGRFVFLNDTVADSENGLVVLTCRQPADPAERAGLEAALGRIAAFGRRQSYRIDVLIVPTVPMLYGDRLPPSIPADLRRDCAAGPAGHPPMGLVRAPEGLRYVYPYAELAALRDDRAMYPIGNYHPSGLSVRTATDAYLRAIGAPVPNVPLALTSGPAEILQDRGVTAPFPVYAPAGPDAPTDEAAGAALSAALQRVQGDRGQAVFVYRDPAAPDPRTVLMLSDSFGYSQGVDFATAFRTVIQTEAPHRDIAPLLSAFGRDIPFDRLVLVFNDNNLGRLRELGERLSAPEGR